ncbi:MAG: Holliday junction branch migration protein RuvA [Cyanobacteria bacterium P01_H01_bin.15]
MIGYLNGTVIDVQELGKKRYRLMLEVANIGYELQISGGFAANLRSQTRESTQQVFTHQVIRDEQILLYGFSSRAERDLFRQLVAVSGIGSQLAIALLDTLGLTTLVSAIVTSDFATLSSTPGVGKKTAERIALELKSKLAEWREETLPAVEPGDDDLGDIWEDVEMTLLALGYSEVEIGKVRHNLVPQLGDNRDPEHWIKSAIAFLS